MPTISTSTAPNGLPIHRISIAGTRALATLVAANVIAFPATGRAAAAGVAAMNTITMFSGFVGPYWMGVMKDATGSDQTGLRGLVLPSLGAACAMYWLTQSLKSRPKLRSL